MLKNEDRLRCSIFQTCFVPEQISSDGRSFSCLLFCLIFAGQFTVRVNVPRLNGPIGFAGCLSLCLPPFRQSTHCRVDEPRLCTTPSASVASRPSFSLEKTTSLSMSGYHRGRQRRICTFSAVSSWQAILRF
jgi:hypothetical protein